MNNVNKMQLKKQQAIDLWRETRGHISNICKAINISRTTFHKWLKEPEFREMLIEAEGELNDDVRDALMQKIADGDMTAIIFYLRKRHPEFQDKPTIEVNQQFNWGVSRGEEQ
jgi:hypothetical protein